MFYIIFASLEVGSITRSSVFSSEISYWDKSAQNKERTNTHHNYVCLGLPYRGSSMGGV